ncbi:MAG TPA: VPLPA-CTERM sorting domain-containing protein [Parvularculaceae bacterium]|nr:VPLPA-CTERM sorting domain-containing protein [Parvularculaceae bacterium]
MNRLTSIGLKSAAIAAAGAICLLAAPAWATVITIGTTGATVTCSVSCEAFSGAGGLNIDPPPPDMNEPTGAGTLGLLAQLYSGSPSDPSTEEGRLETLIFGAPNGSLGTGVQSGSDPATTFMSSALYLVLKLGDHDIFIKNTSGGSQTYTYDAGTSRGLGLSHYTEFEGSEVPLPAAFWLLGAGLAGLGFAGRRRRPV